MSTAETILKRLEAVDLSPLIGSEVHLGKDFKPYQGSAS